MHSCWNRGQLSVLATRLWVAPAEAAREYAGEKGAQVPRVSTRQLPLHAIGSWISRRGRWLESIALWLNLLLLLSHTTHQSSSSKGLQQWMKSLTISAGSDSGASVSAPSQPEPPRAKSCSSQIVFRLLFPSPAHSKVACALTPRKDQREVHWGEVKQLQEFANFLKWLAVALGSFSLNWKCLKMRNSN